MNTHYYTYIIPLHIIYNKHTYTEIVHIIFSEKEANSEEFGEHCFF